MSCLAPRSLTAIACYILRGHIYVLPSGPRICEDIINPVLALSGELGLTTAHPPLFFAMYMSFPVNKRREQPPNPGLLIKQISHPQDGSATPYTCHLVMITGFHAIDYLLCIEKLPVSSLYALLYDDTTSVFVRDSAIVATGIIPFLIFARPSWSKPQLAEISKQL